VSVSIEAKIAVEAGAYTAAPDAVPLLELPQADAAATRPRERARSAAARKVRTN
jgi:hypothetical protein